MARVKKPAPADIRLYFAKSFHGKSYRMNQHMKKYKRIMIWDVMSEYEGTATASRAELVRIVSGKVFRVAYRPKFINGIKDEFAFFCRLAFAAGSLVVVVEELNKVTSPNYAPPAWQDITSRGRHRRLIVFGSSQRPASVDKDAIGNATEIHVGRLRYKRDRVAIAEAFDDETLVSKLSQIKKHEFLVMRDIDEG